MSKKKLPKIFEINYLINGELTEDDLYDLFENNSLIYSLIKHMFVMTGELSSIQMIVEKTKANHKWVDERKFRSHKQRKQFMDEAILVIQNVYQYSNFTAKRWVDDFMFHYGFGIK